MKHEENPELYAHIKKEMTCAYYNGGDCTRVLPGCIQCDATNCVFWRLHDDFKE